MTIKTIATYIAAGYTLNGAKYTGLLITKTGGVGGTGVAASFNTTVQNYGKVNGTGSFAGGVALTAGGSVINEVGGSITGYQAVYTGGGLGTVTNYGTIASTPNGQVGVENRNVGGTITNGSATNTAALITGRGLGVSAGPSVTVGNFATIRSPGTGVGLYGAGDVLTNGSAADGVALIQGAFGVRATYASIVTNNGLIEGTGGSGYGVSLNAGGTLFNYGVVRADLNIGVGLQATGKVINGGLYDTTALIAGPTDGVLVTAGTGSVANFGTITGTGKSGYGVYIEVAGGAVTNGANGVAGALIEGHTGVRLAAAGTVANLGTIESLTNIGVNLSSGGTVTNGSATDSRALIEGYADGLLVSGLAGTITNLATIEALNPSGGAGVALDDGGRLTNGSLTDRTAQITGYRGVSAQNAGGTGAAATIVNYGVISGAVLDGVYLNETGSVTNGAAGDTSALIAGRSGVIASQLATISNFGSIQGEGQLGVLLQVGGSVTNGSTSDVSARIEGFYGVFSNGGTMTLANFGQIHGSGVAGVYLARLGSVTNGALTDTGALIDGPTGVHAHGAGTIVNFATIRGSGSANTYGVILDAGGAVTNGSAKDTKAVIEGYLGVQTVAAATVTNFGTIAGDGGVAVQFNDALATLVVEAGSVFVGQVNGGGGTLELAGGTGTLTGLLLGGNVTVSGSMATTAFSNFATVKIDAGASFALAGSGGTIAAGQSLIDGGALSGSGTLALTGGSATFNAGASLNIASVTLSGASKATVNANLTYAGKWTQSAGTLSVGSGATMSFIGGADSFAGTMANAGVVGIVGVTATIGASGLTLTGAGHVLMTDSATSEITGATAASLLTVGQALTGAGKLGAGKLTLTVQATGVIAQVGANALIIDTGAATIANAGIIEAVGAGGATVVSAVNNTGRLLAFSSLLTVNGVVTGSGTGQVNKGTLKIAATATFNQNVVFSGTGGTLELAHGRTYAGTITGFSTTGGTFLDLDDIPFVSGITKATFSGTTAGGILTVANTLFVAHIHLTGNYTASTFVTASDGHGGTVIHDPAKASVPPHILPAHAFVQAMAGLAAMSGEPLASAHDIWRPPALALPRP